MEVNRLERETGVFMLDGVVVVIDVENWKGYEDTSYTAKMQARYTDMIIFNKWEMVDERRYEDCLDRVGDLEVQIASVKSNKGRVDKDLLLGLDSTLAKADDIELKNGHEEHHDHAHDHQSEVEVLSVALSSMDGSVRSVNLDKLDTLLKSAPKDEIYRIKAIIFASRAPRSSEDSSKSIQSGRDRELSQYILNWAFGRWTFTPMSAAELGNSGPASKNTFGREVHSPGEVSILRMTVILARYEAEKWKKQLESECLIVPENPAVETSLAIQRLI